MLAVTLASAVPGVGRSAAAEAGQGAVLAPAMGASELYRIRITNQREGLVELSANGGDFWEALGKVRKPALGVSVASSTITTVAPGSIAGISRDRLLLRLADSGDTRRSLQVLADGDPGNSASVLTDIPVSGPLFRTLAPPIGSAVQLEKGGRLEPLPPGFAPRDGDRFVILVRRDEDPVPPVVTIENKENGAVTILGASGVPRLVGRVRQALKGIGRYAQTERAGLGCVLSWTPTAILVSTSAERRTVGAGAEERGGFVIQPAEPSLRGTTHPASQLLIEAIAPGPDLQKPSVSALFGLTASLSSSDPADARPTRVEIKIDDGEWEACPDLKGTLDGEGFTRALQTAIGPKRTLKSGITHVRILFGAWTPEVVQRRVKLATAPGAAQPQRGTVKIRADIMGQGVEFVAFYLDGRRVQLTNLPPFAWDWDTSKTLNGEHLVEIRGLDKDLKVVTTAVTRVVVDN